MQDASDNRGNGTRSAPVFVQNAVEIAQKLEGDGSPFAKQMREEALALAEVFRGWETTRPENSVRVAMIQKLLALHRSAMDHLAASRRS